GHRAIRRRPLPAAKTRAELLLVDDLDAELLGLRGLGAGVGPDHDEIRLLRDARGDPGAGGLRRLDRLLARHALQSTGEDDARAGEGLPALGLLHLVLHPNAGLAELLDQPAVAAIGEPVVHAPRD